MPSWLRHLKPYERHLSALAMVGGFIFDNFAFGRIDHPATQIVLAAYLLSAAISIAVLHFFESRAERRGVAFSARPYVSAITQFALGGLWSAFLIFYSRSAAVVVSWPFLAALTAVFLGNEILHEYHSRLVFTGGLFFVALFSYMTFVVPIVVGTINKMTFLLSGALSLAAFAIFLLVLAALGPRRVWQNLGKLVLAALGAYLVLGTFYFLNMLPPIPLALANAGVYQKIDKQGDTYIAVGEPQPWFTHFGVPMIVHIKRGAPLYFFSAVYAPIELHTEIAHEWQRYDSRTRRWVTKTTITYPITGGRNRGYRGYSMKSHLMPGLWRVNIDTLDGRVIGRIDFKIEIAAHAPAGLVTTRLN